MKNLFLIDGTAGSGKSDLLEYIFNYRQDITLVQKYTTRAIRDYEIKQRTLLDLIFVSPQEFDNKNLEYQYMYRGHKYGFLSEELERALARNKNVFVIVRSADVIRAIKEKYSFINVRALFVYTDQTLVNKRLTKEGLSEERIKVRLQSFSEAFDDYVRNFGIYDETIINDSNKVVYQNLIDKTLAKYKFAPEIDENLIFVLMSFDPGNPSLKDYYGAMQRAVEKAKPGMRCLNLDDVIPGSPQISEAAKTKIRSCRLAIVDLTGNRPNVFYELGYVHGIKHPFVITAHKNTPQVFYSSHYRIHYYENATELENTLYKQLIKML